MYSVCSTEQRDGCGLPTGERDRSRARERELEVNREVCQWRSSSSSLCRVYRLNKLSTEFLQEPFDLSERSTICIALLSFILIFKCCESEMVRAVSAAANKPLSLMRSYTNTTLTPDWCLRIKIRVCSLTYHFS